MVAPLGLNAMSGHVHAWAVLVVAVATICWEAAALRPLAIEPLVAEAMMAAEVAASAVHGCFDRPHMIC